MLAFRNIERKHVENTIKNPDDYAKGQENKIVLYKKFNKIYLKVVIVKETNEVIVITNHWIAKKRIKK